MQPISPVSLSSNILQIISCESISGKHSRNSTLPGCLALAEFDALEMQAQQIERGQRCQAFVILTAGAPAGTHARYNPFRPIDGDIHRTGRLSLLLFRPGHTGDAESIIRVEIVANSMSHRARRLFADDTI